MAQRSAHARVASTHEQPPAASRRRHRLARAAAALALAAALSSPAATYAATKQFNAGSLIIPASVEYQPTDTGILSTYALVYVALWKNADRVAAGQKPITFYWAVHPQKLSQYRCNTMTNTLPSYGQVVEPLVTTGYNDNDGCDFYVNRAVAAGGQPVALLSATGTEVAPFDVSDLQYAPQDGPSRKGSNHSIGASTTVVKYLGGSWVVDSTDCQAFLEMLATVPELAPFHKNGTGANTFVNIHSARAAFSAPVASALTVKPPRIALTGESSQIAFLVNVLENAGLCTNGNQFVLGSSTLTCRGTFNAAGFTSGVVYDYYANTADLLSPVSGLANGRLNEQVSGVYKYGIYWGGDGTDATAAQMSAIAAFADAGGTVFAEDDSPVDFENSGVSFQTTTGVNNINPNIDTFEDCNDQLLPNGSFFKGTGTPCLVYGAANQPYSQSGNFLFEGGQGNHKGYVALDAFLPGVSQVLRVRGSDSDATVSSARNYQNNPQKGLILYLAGHKFDNGRFWGQRIILNTIFSRLNPLTGVELARSEPVGYKNTAVTPNTTRVYQGTYVQQPLPDSNDVITYNPAAAQIWDFPRTVGQLYEYNVGASTGATLSSTAQAFNQNKNWDAGCNLVVDAKCYLSVAPGARDLFTYVGGSANLGWKRISFDYSETGALNGRCTDTNSNGKCDLSELLLSRGKAAEIQPADLKGPNDASGGVAQAKTLGLLVQQARGFCSAHDPAITGEPIFEPDLDDCDCRQSGVNCGDAPQTNNARLGGIDHGSAAVVGPSRYLTESPWVNRPVFAYAAGHDGMLHAFYVSGPTNWTAHGRTLPPGVQSGQEIWALVLPGQVGGIAVNDALVDGSINVVDVFANFPRDRVNALGNVDERGDGVIDWANEEEQPNGIRTWRTVLIASAGLGGSEMFALDVTNPLKPVLLWHLAGAALHDGRFDLDANGAFGRNSTTGVVNEFFDSADPSTYALKWFDWDDGNSGTDHIPTDYNVIGDTDEHRRVIEDIKSGRYDYRNLGLTYSAPVAKIWTGGAFRYVAYIATNAADYATGTPTGFRGIEVFAIDVVTGQKLWQWEHLYAASNASGIDNGIPPAVALGDIDANGSTERIYVADMEGHLWELSAKEGRNLNYLETSAGGRRSFPLFGTPVMTGTGATDATKDLYRAAGGGLGQQPLTTPIGEGRFSAVPAASTGFDPQMLLGRLALLVGTMGVDWSIAPHEAGHIYVIPSYPDAGTRLLPPINLAATRDPLKFGVLLPKAVWDVPLDTGERVYGMPRVANNMIVFNTAFGSFTGDISSSYLDSGNLKLVTSAATDTRTNNTKAFGGALLIGGSVVITTDNTIRVLSNPPAALTSVSGTAQSTFNRATPAVVKTWEPLSR